MMPDRNFPSVIDWELKDPLEKAIWGTTFAIRLAQGGPEEAAAMANEAVRSALSLSPNQGTSFDPAMRASQAAIEITRADFEVWFRVELKLQAGRWRQYDANPTSEDIDNAFERYSRGKSDFY